MIGQTLGPYQILAKLGEGGMGEVIKDESGAARLNIALNWLSELTRVTPRR